MEKQLYKNKIFCRGFNLYGQLNHLDIVLSQFLKTVEGKQIKSLYVSHSFGIITYDKSVKIISGVLPKNLEDTLTKLEDIIEISCNNTLILILNDKHKLFKININSPEKIEPVPNFIEENDDIKKISVGETFNVAYTESGQIYSIPEKLDFENKEIMHIKTGREHCLLLHANGEIFSFGRGSRGQLGHGSLEDEINPKLIEALAGVKVVQIAAGGWHSLALSADGDLYSWGWNGNGQLGISTDQNKETSVQVMATPTLVEFEQNVKKIACGVRHSLALLDHNILYGCGWNKYKQLIEDTQENYYSFVSIYKLSEKKNCDVICGPWNSVVLCA